jgi:hypothetical protein
VLKVCSKRVGLDGPGARARAQVQSASTTLELVFYRADLWPAREWLVRVIVTCDHLLHIHYSDSGVRRSTSVFTLHERRLWLGGSRL